jgi:hypothetical protein
MLYSILSQINKGLRRIDILRSLQFYIALRGKVLFCAEFHSVSAGITLQKTMWSTLVAERDPYLSLLNCYFGNLLQNIRKVQIINP